MVMLTRTGAQAALPEPPEQHTPWQLPSNAGVPEYVVEVSAQLFAFGLADPRGGEYRSVEVLNVHRRQSTVQTHAWLFPGGFAVCWDGLVYRVKTVGAVADLDSDVETILAAKPWSGRLPAAVRSRSDSKQLAAAFWYGMQSNATIVPASIALLLRLGRVELAAKLWAAPEEPSGFRGEVRPHETDEGLWLATAGKAWFAPAYWRLVFALEGGDDREAADVGESILEWRSRVPPAWQLKNPWSPQRVPDISFLDPVPEIAADARRRLSEPRREVLDLTAVARDKTGASDFLRQPQPARIAQLSDRLDDVLGAKLTYPGILVFSSDPIYQLLVREGNAAVSALFDAYEKDTRLTRTFEYSRPWSIDYTPISVHEVASLILVDVLGDSAWKAKTPAEFRAWWRERSLTGRGK
jgi:hypothetical protein